jgi:hypothetical protein
MSDYRKEKRKLLRKKINLGGYYWKHLSHGVLEKMEKVIVIDLSNGGCRICASDDHDLHVNDSITLTFRFDNAERTKIQKEAVVYRVNGNYIGCRFSFEYDKDIWSYLHGDMSQ